MASPDGREGSVTIYSDASIRVGLFDGDESATLPLDPTRKAYVQVARGSVTVQGQALAQGDAIKLEGESGLQIAHGQGAEVLVFDLAA